MIASLSTPLPKVIGHRGAAGLAPENTLASIRKAAAFGARWVEFDVKLSADGVPILMHDDTLRRTTNGRGKVAATAWAALQQLDAGGWFDDPYKGEPIPSLEAALALLADLRLSANIELKPCKGRESETAFKALQVVKASWPADLPPPLISSFARESLIAAREVAPELPRALLVGRVPRNPAPLLAELGCSALNPAADHLTSGRVAALKEAGITLFAYTVNDPSFVASLQHWGVDGVFTDRPDLMSALA
ncbi:MAG: glycerophosphodiester phosphodiesterase [Geminicoccaceae bacterium]